MNLLDLQTAVMDLIKRPDMQAVIDRRVVAAIRELHTKDYFQRDLVEEVIKIEVPETEKKITLPPFWRRFAVMRPFTELREPISLSWTKHQDFEPCDPAYLFSNDNITNVYYVSQSTFTVRSECTYPRLYVAYWKYPDLRRPDVVTWVTEYFEQLVIDYAAASLFAAMGNRELFGVHKTLAAEQLELFLSSNQTVGDL